MTVERKDVPGLAEPPGYQHYAVGRGSRLVFTAGAVPLDAAGELIGAGDHEAQTEQVPANLLATLEAAGARPADVVKTTVHVVGDGREPRSPCGASSSVPRSRRRRARWSAWPASATRASWSRSRTSRSSTRTLQVRRLRRA